MPPDFLRAAILDQTVQMAEDSGGFEVLDATESDPHALKAHVRERKTKHVIEMSVQVDPAMPERITLITLNGPDERVKDTR
jgi:hypothetical protein